MAKKTRKQPTGRDNEALPRVKAPTETKIPCDFSHDQSINDSSPITIVDDPAFPSSEKGYSPAKRKKTKSAEGKKGTTHEKGTSTKACSPTKKGGQRKKTSKRTTIYSENQGHPQRQDDALVHLCMSPGAVPVQGVSSHANSDHGDSNDKQETSTWNSHTIAQLVVAAEIAPDDEDAAARMAERMEQQIKDEVELRLRAQHRTEVVAEAVVTDKSFILCGIQRITCLCIILILLFVVGGTTTGFVLSKVDNDSYVPPTASPTEVSTSSPTPPPTRIEKKEALRQELESYIIRTEEDLILFEDPSSPQSLALQWLSTDSSSISDDRSTVFILERYVLALLYFSTDGANWRFQGLEYMSEGTVCDWNNGLLVHDEAALGIFCDGPSPVYFILLDSVGLAGKLPWELSLLSNLLTLDFDKNMVQGTIPTEFSGLENLEALLLFSNRLTGPLPVHLPSSLRYIGFEGNSFTGSIPSSWGDTLSSVIHLYLGVNELSGQLPSELGQLTTLTVFAIYNNAFTGPIPSELGQLTAMDRLWMNDNEFTGAPPTELAQLLYMKFFSIHDNHLTGSLNDSLCVSRIWSVFESDCLAQGYSPAEIECTCCTTCCSAAADYCEVY